MTPVMYTTGWSSGLTLLWGVHSLSMVAFGVGLLFFLFWAFKHLHERQLKNWGVGLLVGGGIACLLTLGLLGPRWDAARGTRMYCSGGKTDGMMEGRAGMGGMGMMDDDDEDDAQDNDEASAASAPSGMMGMMNGSAGAGMMAPKTAMGMSMQDMVSVLQGKTGDAFDKAFLEGMIPHHQGAVAMAHLAEKNAKHGEIRELARDIIGSQQHEIDAMRQWQRNWGYGQ